VESATAPILSFTLNYEEENTYRSSLWFDLVHKDVSKLEKSNVGWKRGTNAWGYRRQSCDMSTITADWGCLLWKTVSSRKILVTVLLL